MWCCSTVVPSAGSSTWATERRTSAGVPRVIGSVRSDKTGFKRYALCPANQPSSNERADHLVRYLSATVPQLQLGEVELERVSFQSWLPARRNVFSPFFQGNAAAASVTRGGSCHGLLEAEVFLGLLEKRVIEQVLDRCRVLPEIESGRRSRKGRAAAAAPKLQRISHGKGRLLSGEHNATASKGPPAKRSEEEKTWIS